MVAEPTFDLHAEFDQLLGLASGPKSVPEGKGGHVFVDGELHRILDIERKLSGRGAYAHGVNEREIVHLCAHLDVAFLAFKGLRTTTIAPLRELPRLRKLNLWWVQKLEDLSPLAGMALDTLLIEEIRKASDISPLAELPKLAALTLGGGMSADQFVETLEPLTRLPRLKELRLMSLKVGDDTLRCLADCATLTDLNLPNTFPTEDYAYLLARRPDINCTALAAYQHINAISGKDVLVTGRRKPFLSSKKDQKRLENYQARFDEMVATYRSGG